MKRLIAVAIVLLAWAVVAAAQVDLGSIKRVAIDPAIPDPGIPLIQSPGNFKAFVLGGVGAAIDQQEAGKLFREYMRKNNIDIATIVLASIRRAIEEDKPFALGADGDAKLKLVINSYGFGAAGFFGGSERKPLLNVTASLVSNAGEVVWKKTEFITNLSKATEAYTYDQLGVDPALTAKSFEQASLLVSRQLVAGLKR